MNVGWSSIPTPDEARRLMARAEQHGVSESSERDRHFPI
jgi:hypothetical protein